jgi:hypothetical protein
LVAGAIPERSFIGGMRLPWSVSGRNWFGGYNATWPLVRLSLFSDGLRLRGTRFAVVTSLIPVWEARYDELSEVSAVERIPFITTGVRLRSKDDPNDWVVFWALLTRAKVLQALAGHGVTVTTKPVRLRPFRPGR